MKNLSEKFARFSLKHRGLATLLSSLVYCIGVTFIFYSLGCSTAMIVVGNIFCILFCMLAVGGASSVLMMPAIKLLDEECHPEPLLYECEEQLKYRNNNVNNFTIVMNKAVALIYMGEFEKAKDNLESINIDLVNTTPIYKGTYYNNLSYAYALLGDKQMSDIWFNKALNNFEGVKGKRYLDFVKSLKDFAAVENELYEGNFEKVLELSEAVQCQCTRQRVSLSLIQAKAYIGLSDFSKAKDKLDFVKEKGGTLFHVKEAEKLMSELNGKV